MKSRYLLPLLPTIFGLVVFNNQIARSEATVGCYWDYETVANNFDQGEVNGGVFNANDFTKMVGAFQKTTTDSQLAISASEGRVHLLNSFSINNGAIKGILSQLVDVAAAAGFADRLTIVDPSRTGQPGTYIGSIRVNMQYTGRDEIGSRNVFGVGVGSTFSNARTASGNVFYDDGGRSTYAYLGFGPAAPQSFNDQIVTFAVPFTFGVEFGMAVWMESYIGTDGRTRIGMAKNHDASNTVEWAGTVGVKDGAGSEVAAGSFNLTSKSSRNYLTEITGTATYSSWLTANNLSGDDALATADPDHNGNSNLLDYAFGVNPATGGGIVTPAAGFIVINGESYLTLTYTRPSGTEGRTDVVYTPERSTSPSGTANWSSSASDVTYSIAPAGLNREAVTVRSVHPTSAMSGTEFLRLKVTN